MTEAPDQRDYDPPPDHPVAELVHRVRDAMRALPAYFASVTAIEGLQATDLFTLNTVLGATIEVQVVETLNRIRDVWDPNDDWPLHYFTRQPQTFPDVLLVHETDDGPDVALGIELKGWYLLSAEAEPSFRYKVTPAACGPYDLLAVVPWHLSNVLSGTPRVTAPGLWSARYAAEHRNWWWQHARTTTLDASIVAPQGAAPYQRRQPNSDKPAADSGRNFGRIARTGIMDRWVARQLDVSLAGVTVREWIEFFRHQQGAPP